MGLSSFPSAEGVLPVLVMNTVLSVALLKNVVRSVLQLIGGSEDPPHLEEDHSDDWFLPFSESAKERRISVTLFKSLCNNRPHLTGSGGDCWSAMECCVCLYEFEAEEEVGELSCKHFFHKRCLEKWLNHNHSTCPLCRSTL